MTTILAAMTPDKARATFGMSERTDEQVQWYCDLDALVLRAEALEIPAEAIMQAIAQVAEYRLLESIAITVGLDFDALVAEANDGDE